MSFRGSAFSSTRSASLPSSHGAHVVGLAEEHRAVVGGDLEHLRRASGRPGPAAPSRGERPGRWTGRCPAPPRRRPPPTLRTFSSQIGVISFIHHGPGPRLPSGARLGASSSSRSAALKDGDIVRLVEEFGVLDEAAVVLADGQGGGERDLLGRHQLHEAVADRALDHRVGQGVGPGVDRFLASGVRRRRASSCGCRARCSTG